MEGIEQGRLRLSGIPCAGPPFSLGISQGFNRHGRMQAGVWAAEGAGKEIHAGMPVVLEVAGEGAAPVFCGVVTACTAGKEKGQDCLYIEAETGSVLLDMEKGERSFQRQGRSCRELVGEVASRHQGYPVWGKGAGGEQECGFLLQYRETGWEFIRRVASAMGNSLLPECRFAGNGFYVGLPDSPGETVLEPVHYTERRRIPGSILEDGTICTGPEYVARKCRQTLYPGERVRFRGQRLAVAGKESRLEGGVLENTYTLRREDAFRAAPVYNYRMAGASIAGTVTESSPDCSRLKLETDGEGEAAESWHSRPVFYSGGGAGYSGRPERGDTLYLYFPTEREEDRCVIGGGGAGCETLRKVTQQIMDDTAAGEEEAEKSRPLPLGVENRETAGTGRAPAGASGSRNARTAQKADAASMTGYKNWSTPGNQGVSLNPKGIRLQTGSGTAIGMGSGGTGLASRGDMELSGKNGAGTDMLLGKQAVLKAGEYILVQCGMSAAALLPGEIHLKGTLVKLDSPLNRKEEPEFNDSVVEILKEAYYNEKWGSPLQLFMPDGTAIGRVKGLEESGALRKYFGENILGTEGYPDYVPSPEFEEYRGDGTLEQEMRREHETIQYLKWLSATYGKTGAEKVWEWLGTKEGRHNALDGAGIFLEPADAANALLYLLEWDIQNAALSGVSIFPLLGDYLGKGAKGVLKAADLAKLKRNRKVARVLDSLELFIKVPREELEEARKWIRKSWDDIADGMQAKEMATTEGMTVWIRPSDNFRARINMMDEAGDVFQDTLQAGRKAGDGGEVAGAAAKILEEGVSAKGLIGHDFEDYLSKAIGGDGSFTIGGRDFDGGVGSRWWEAKSGSYWTMLEENPRKLEKFKSDMGDRLKIATENGATYELFSNTPIPESIKQWLTKKGIPFTELLD